MGKVRKIDFILYEDKDEVLIFRFYPRLSSCHSFNDIPPTKWEEVYKVYYSYKIFKRYKDDNYTYILFDCGCDECSIIDEVAERIKYIVDDKKEVTITHMKNKEYTVELLGKEVIPRGDGVSWIINEYKQHDIYEIILWNFDETGYRFYLKKDKLKEFGKYLNECCEYMLAHGDPI